MGIGIRRGLRSQLLFGLCAVLAGAAIWGSAVAATELRRAVARSRELYRLDAEGSQIESDLESQVQESRCAFLYALAETGPNRQLPSMDDAREADEKVSGSIGRFRLLHAPVDLTRSIRDFEISWREYDTIRDEAAAEILAGDLQGAMNLDRRRGNDAFLAALRNLHALKRTLEDHARARSDQADRTLRRGIVGLAFFLAGTLFIIFVLARMNRAGAAAAKVFRLTNAELENAQEMDRHRVAILEMVAKHAPLSRILTAIAEMASRHQPGAGAAFWSIARGTLLYQASAGLPGEVTNSLRSRSFECEGGNPTPNPETRREIAEMAGRANLKQTSIPLRNAAGDAVGLLLILYPSGSIPYRSREASWLVMAQLASLAIENTLMYERLAFQAQHDVLTGLPNRLLFQDRVQQAILRAQRNRRNLAVLYFDLDRFKQINDTQGHRIGDEVLREFARRLTSSIRGSDTAARIGGDEFVVLLADLDGPSSFQVVVEKLMKQIRAPLAIPGCDLKMSASAGVSVYPEHGPDPAALLRNADLAMYQAKLAGRDTFHVFQKELSESLERRLTIERELEGAIERGEFHLAYQPLIGRHDELAAFEALLRWDNRTLGAVSPAEFIPIAEEAGMILRIGEWAARTVCQEGARWMKQGIEAPRIAVNASGLQFADMTFSGMIRSALADSGFPASKLEIEVTETALVGNLEAALTQIARLRELGIRFAIDDFGIGYSSLNQLRTLPVDCVKVDQSFTKDLERMAGDSTALVRGIIGMAHSLGLDVVAEGVETEGQLAILRSLGCDVVQGFYLHRPLTVKAAEELMKAYGGSQRPAFSGVARKTTPAPADPRAPELVPESIVA